MTLSGPYLENFGPKSPRTKRKVSSPASALSNAAKQSALAPLETSESTSQVFRPKIIPKSMILHLSLNGKSSEPQIALFCFVAPKIPPYGFEIRFYENFSEDHFRLAWVKWTLKTGAGGTCPSLHGWSIIGFSMVLWGETTSSWGLNGWCLGINHSRPFMDS